MEEVRKILAPTDLSELSKTGVRYALNLGKAFGAEVTVYHVVNLGELKEYGEEIKKSGTAGSTPPPPGYLLDKYKLALTRFLNDHFPDVIPSVRIRQKVELGKAERNIVEEASKEGTDLIVISTHGRTGLSHMLIGSVTEKVVRNAPCPVLSIRPKSGVRAEEALTTALLR